MSALTDQTIPKPAIQKLAKIVGGDAASLNKLVPHFLELWRSLQPITEHKCSIGNPLPMPLHALEQFDDLVFRNEGFSILAEIIGVIVQMASSGHAIAPCGSSTSLRFKRRNCRGARRGRSICRSPSSPAVRLLLIYSDLFQNRSYASRASARYRSGA